MSRRQQQLEGMNDGRVVHLAERRKCEGEEHHVMEPWRVVLEREGTAVLPLPGGTAFVDGKNTQPQLSCIAYQPTIIVFFPSSPLAHIPFLSPNYPLAFAYCASVAGFVSCALEHPFLHRHSPVVVASLSTGHNKARHQQPVPGLHFPGIVFHLSALQ